MMLVHFDEDLSKMVNAFHQNSQVAGSSSINLFKKLVLKLPIITFFRPRKSFVYYVLPNKLFLWFMHNTY